MGTTLAIVAATAAITYGVQHVAPAIKWFVGKIEAKKKAKNSPTETK